MTGECAICHRVDILTDAHSFHGAPLCPRCSAWHDVALDRLTAALEAGEEVVWCVVRNGHNLEQRRFSVRDPQAVPTMALAMIHGQVTAPAEHGLP